MKKIRTDKEESSSKQPKTELDVKFLAAVAEYMSKRGVSSDRAMSLALGRSENFLNRVRNGYQSATPEAWSALLDKYPEAQNVTTNNVMTQGGGQAIGTNYGEATQDIDHIKPKHQAGSPYYEWNNLRFVSAETHDALKREVELLKGQLADKERIIQLLEKNSQK